jgi:hypothetical protein
MMMKLFLLYTDPGSGVMLLQVLLAFIGGGLFYFRNLIKSLFGLKRPVSGDLDGVAESKEDVDTKAR